MALIVAGGGVLAAVMQLVRGDVGDLRSRIVHLEGRLASVEQELAKERSRVAQLERELNTALFQRDTAVEDLAEARAYIQVLEIRIARLKNGEPEDP